MPTIDNNAWNNCYFVQYSIDKGKIKIHPRGIRNIYPVTPKGGNAPFYGVTGGTKYGIRKLKGTTHWGIIDASDLSKLKFVHTDAYPEVNSVPQVIKSRGHYVIIRSSPSNVKLYISKHQSYQQMRKDMKRRQAGS